MAKKGMKRIDRTHTKPKNEQPPVPEISGKANPIIAGTVAPSQKGYHTVPHKRSERSISSAYSVIDNDLARDNMENDISAADKEDL